MPLIHSLLSLTLAAAPSGSIAPQSRAIDDGAEVLEVEPAEGTAPRTGAQVETLTEQGQGTRGLSSTTAADGTGARPEPHVPRPDAGVDDLAEDRGFDPDPVYLGCGHLVPACERLTTVGAVTGGAGIALIASSTALLLTPDQVIADEPAYVRNYTRTGTTLLALGLGLATTGLLMVLTAARASHSRRLRRNKTARRAPLPPPLARRGGR